MTFLRSAHAFLSISLVATLIANSCVNGFTTSNISSKTKFGKTTNHVKVKHTLIDPSPLCCDQSRSGFALYSKEENDNDSQKGGSLIADIADKISLLVSYVIQFIGVALSLGLVLNILGYAYSFDLKKGLEIDTLENRRKQVQFEREIIRSSRMPEIKNTNKELMEDFNPSSNKI